MTRKTRTPRDLATSFQTRPNMLKAFRLVESVTCGRAALAVRVSDATRALYRADANTMTLAASIAADILAA